MIDLFTLTRAVLDFATEWLLWLVLAAVLGCLYRIFKGGSGE